MQQRAGRSSRKFRDGAAQSFKLNVERRRSASCRPTSGSDGATVSRLLVITALGLAAPALAQEEERRQLPPKRPAEGAALQQGRRRHRLRHVALRQFTRARTWGPLPTNDVPQLQQLVEFNTQVKVKRAGALVSVSSDVSLVANWGGFYRGVDDASVARCAGRQDEPAGAACRQHQRAVRLARVRPSLERAHRQEAHRLGAGHGLQPDRPAQPAPRPDRPDVSALGRVAGAGRSAALVRDVLGGVRAHRAQARQRHSHRAARLPGVGPARTRSCTTSSPRAPTRSSRYGHQRDVLLRQQVGRRLSRRSRAWGSRSATSSVRSRCTARRCSRRAARATT
jgi:hypothetical protein